MSELIGTNLGQYEIIGHIARGGMAEVYLARQPSMNRNVAIKVLPVDSLEDETFLERFYIEVEIIAHLQHPHILPVHDFGVQDGMPYIVMAFIDGKTLMERASQSLSNSDVLQIGQQIADALDFAHSRGIIHRDLKPGNVLMDVQGNAYLADFGLAKVLESDERTSESEMVGTPFYMSPEQVQSDELSPMTDVYSFGVVLYEMLSGELPYNEGSALQIMLAHLRDPVPNILDSRSDLPDPLQDIFHKVLAKEPSDRFASAGEFMKVLRGIFSPASMALQAQPALIMTDNHGHVIFVDNHCLLLLKRQQHEARAIIGKTIDDVLGVDETVTLQLFKAIDTNNAIENVQIEITNSRGKRQMVICNAIATRDDKGTFVGADIQLATLPKDTDDPPSSDFLIIEPDVNTREQMQVRDYFATQLQCLYKLSKNWGGSKVAARYELLINEVAERNDWAFEMNKGEINTDNLHNDLDMFKALSARGMNYTAFILGKKQVIKELDRMHKKMDTNMLSIVQMLGLDTLHQDILD